MRGYKGKHRKQQAAGRRIGPAVAVTAVSAVALGAGVTQVPMAQAAQVIPAHPAAPASYTVAAGDTLSQIAENHLGDAGLWPQLARRNGLSSTLIYPGQVLSLGEGAATSLPRAHAAPASYRRATSYHRGYQPRYSADVSEHAGTYSHAGLESLWMAAGGSAATAAHAACIAEHESSGNARAVSPYNDYGLFQELNKPEALDPMKSAQIAVQMSHGGSDWSQWGTAGSC